MLLSFPCTYKHIYSNRGTATYRSSQYKVHARLTASRQGQSWAGNYGFALTVENPSSQKLEVNLKTVIEASGDSRYSVQPVIVLQTFSGKHLKIESSFSINVLPQSYSFETEGRLNAESSYFRSISIELRAQNKKSGSSMTSLLDVSNISI